VRRLVTLLLILLTSYPLLSQTESDSLIDAFQHEKNDSLRIDAVLNLYDLLANDHPDSIFTYIQEALTLAKKENLDQLTIKLMLKKGQIYDRMNNSVEAQKTYLNTKKLIDSVRTSLPDSIYYDDFAYATNNLALVYFRTGKLEDARRYFLEIIQYLEEATKNGSSSRFKRLFTITYNNLGGTYLQAFDYDPAETYYLKALSYLEPDNKLSMSSILNNLGIIEKDRGNYELSMDYLRRAIALRRETQNMEGVIQSLNNLGHLLWRMVKV